MAHCSVKGGEDGYHIFACFVYLFVFVLEVVLLIFHSPFMNQDASLFNLQLHKIKSILIFNINLVGLFVALITDENMFVCLHLTHVFPNAIGVVGHCACRCNLIVWQIHKKKASLKTIMEIFKDHNIYPWLLCIELLF